MLRAEVAEAASRTQGPRGDEVECCLCPRCSLHMTQRVTSVASRVARARLDCMDGWGQQAGGGRVALGESVCQTLGCLNLAAGVM